MKIEKIAPLIHLISILDRSGSMASSEDKVVSSYNELIEMQRSKGINCVVSLYLFDDRLEAVYQSVPLKEVQPLTTDTYKVRGMTALYDAVGCVIQEHISDENVFFVVDTDGQENGSREYKADQIREMIAGKTAAGWEFLFVGADLTEEQTAQMGTTMGFTSTAVFDKSVVGYATRSVSLDNSLSAYAASVNTKAAE